jgi:SAM-dependent methyltransferase
LYTPEFFEALTDDSVRSASVVVPLAMDLLKPASVVDVGCGTGIWLAAFRAAGVQRVLGIDGDYVDRRALRIPEGSFISTDLASGHGFGIAETFDLALSLEVAEHLPSSAAEKFIGGLVRLAPMILFSAAVPGQTGIGHVNEQWPDYWAAHFSRHRYLQLDSFRTRLWRDTRVAWWYRQNLFLYVDETRVPAGRRETLAQGHLGDSDLFLVHRSIMERLEVTIARQRDRLDRLATGRGALRTLVQSAGRLARRSLGLPGGRADDTQRGSE